MGLHTLLSPHYVLSSPLTFPFSPLFASSVLPGKTTLLYGMLGEVEQTAGSTALGGTIAYVPQIPFIINATLQDNILFGNAFQQQRYNACLDACCLRQDIAILPNGDHTEIGERGINLSGGQKQRVQLARAAYQHSDLVLLDDPLSAVDPHVAEQLFTQCIQGLMKGRARVLVTHSLAFVDAADNVALLTSSDVPDCYTIVQGTAAELRENNAEFQSLLATYTRGGEDMQEGEKAKPKVATKPVVKGSLITVPDTGDKAKGSLMEEEEQETGVVDWSVYRAYIVAGCSRWQYLIIPLTFLGAQAIQTSSDFWLSKWSNDFNSSVGPYLGVYAALIFATTFVTIFRSFSVSTFGLRASRMLHHNLAHSVLRKCISWYDRTPSGRLTNRFTKVTHLLLQCTSHALGTLVSPRCYPPSVFSSLHRTSTPSTTCQCTGVCTAWVSPLWGVVFTSLLLCCDVSCVGFP